MKITGNILNVELVEVDKKNNINVFEVLTDNSSSGRIYLYNEEKTPQIGENIVAISDSDGNILNYSIN